MRLVNTTPGDFWLTYSSSTVESTMKLGKGQLRCDFYNQSYFASESIETWTLVTKHQKYIKSSIIVTINTPIEVLVRQ